MELVVEEGLLDLVNEAGFWRTGVGLDDAWAWAGTGGGGMLFDAVLETDC